MSSDVDSAMMENALPRAVVAPAPFSLKHHEPILSNPSLNRTSIRLAMLPYGTTFPGLIERDTRIGDNPRSRPTNSPHIVTADWTLYFTGIREARIRRPVTGARILPLQYREEKRSLSLAACVKPQMPPLLDLAHRQITMKAAQAERERPRERH